METSTVHLFVFDTMSDWEYGYLIAGVNNPQFQLQPGRFKVETVATFDKPITTIGGLQVRPSSTLDELEPRDSAMLVLPGGTAWDENKNADAARKAADFIAAGVPVAAICGATTGLARVGLLDAVSHTSNSRAYLAQTGYQGGKHYQDQPSVVSGPLITASAMAPIEFARDAFSVLGVYSDKVLKAWYGLYKTGDANYFEALMEASSAK